MVPFMFTVKNLNIEGKADGLSGDFTVPSYRELACSPLCLLVLASWWRGAGSLSSLPAGAGWVVALRVSVTAARPATRQTGAWLAATPSGHAWCAGGEALHWRLNHVHAPSFNENRTRPPPLPLLLQAARPSWTPRAAAPPAAGSM